MAREELFEKSSSLVLPPQKLSNGEFINYFIKFFEKGMWGKTRVYTVLRSRMRISK